MLVRAQPLWPAVMALLLACLAVPLHAFNMQLDHHSATRVDRWASDEQDDRPKKEKKRVLVVDLRGPSRMQGDGVRVMGMLMDLLDENCDYEVHSLSNAEDLVTLKTSWGSPIVDEFLGQVHLRNRLEFPNDPSTGNGSKTSLELFDRIIVGAKLDLLYPQGAGVVTDVLQRMINNPGRLRERTSIFWDDVPFVRCSYRPEADEMCPKVPGLVRHLATVAREFFVLTPEDQRMMTYEMKKHHIDISEIPIRIWPMRISNMARLLRSQRFNNVDDVDTKDYIVMMGNHHPVNTKNLQTLFRAGIVHDICSANGRLGTSMKLVFLGPLTVEAEKLHTEALSNSSNMDCVSIRAGFIEEDELNEEILPRTRAVLNPFFFNVHSGISVKTYEAITDGFPIVTSKFGMHGLKDVEGCNKFPMPDDPENTQMFVDFVIENVMDRAGYASFLEQFKLTSRQCGESQAVMYKVQDTCK